MFYREDTDHVESEFAAANRARALRFVRIALLAVFVLSFLKLATGTAPWSKTVLQRLEKVLPEDSDAKSWTTFSKWLTTETEYPKLVRANAADNATAPKEPVEQKMLRAKEHAIIGTWYAAAFTAGISFLLLITAPLWMPRGKEEDIEEDEAHAESKGDAGFAKLMSDGPALYLLLVAAMVVGAWFRVPMTTHSLWNDEEYAMRRFALGDVEDGKFEPVTWTETLFENHNGNNHVLHSVLSRVSLSAWHAMHSDAKPSDFSEAALRAPSLIAGILTIALLGILGWELGLPLVGVGAAWFLALHPWHMRYSAEAKGYSLCLFFACLAIIGLVRAMRHNRVGSWLLFALGQAGFLLSFAGSIYLAIALNVVVLVECLWRKQTRHFASVLAFSLIAAIPVATIITPSVPQVLGFMSAEKTQHIAPSEDWRWDLGSHLAIGFQYNNLPVNEHVGTSWMAMRSQRMDAISIMGWSIVLLALLGLSVAMFENVAGRLGIVAPVLAALLAYWHASGKGHPNLPMYYIYLLIPLTLACALAAVRLRVLPGLVVALLIGGYALGTQIPRTAFVEHDRQPIRQTVSAIRDRHPTALTGVFGVSDRQAQSYDPTVTIIKKPEDVDALLAKGNETKRLVFFYFAGLKESTNRSPQIMRRVAQSADLVPYKELKGHEAMFSYYIYAQPGVK